MRAAQAMRRRLFNSTAKRSVYSFSPAPSRRVVASRKKV